MQRSAKANSGPAALSLAVLALVLALAGCGGSGAAKEAVIPLTSSAIEGGELPARYTCDGKNIAPPLRWGEVPAGTRELVLFAIGKEAGAATASGRSTIEWALAGVRPELHEITAGQVPGGAFMVKASNGKARYSLCPGKGQSRLYAFAVYAVPKKVIVTPAVSGLTLYHNLAEGPPKFRATARGALTATYTRK